MLTRLTITLTLLTALIGCSRGNPTLPINEPPNLTPLSWSLDGIGRTGLCGGISGDLFAQLVADKTQQYPDPWLSIVNLSTKSEIWKQATPFDINFSYSCSGIATDGNIWGTFILNTGTVVFSLDGISSIVPPPDGTIANPPFTSPVIIGKTLIVGNAPIASGSGYLYAYDLSNPNSLKLLWKRELSGIVQSMSSDGSVLYVGYQYFEGEDYKAFVEAVNSSTGITIWKASTLTNNAGWHTPTAIQPYQNKLIVVAFDRLQAFNQDTGERLWVLQESMATHCPGGGQNDWPILVENGQIFVNSKGGKCVYSLNVADGSIAWVQNVEKGASFGGRPVLVRGVLYAANGYLWGFDAKTGNPLSVTKELDPYAYNINLYYYPTRDEIVFWSDGVKAYKPIQ